MRFGCRAVASVICSSVFSAAFCLPVSAQEIDVGPLGLDLSFLDLSLLDGLDTAVASAVVPSPVLNSLCQPPVGNACSTALNAIGATEAASPQLVTNTIAGSTAQTMAEVADFALSQSLDQVISGSLPSAAVNNLSPNAESFGISGVSHTSHDGFSVEGRGVNGRSPRFDTLDVGGTLGLRYDASRWANLSRDTLTLGVYGNYTNSDIEFKPTRFLKELGYSRIGTADVDGGTVGGYALATNGFLYGLALGSGQFGSASVRNHTLDSRGSFDTSGASAALLAGRIIPLSPRASFDLRGGLNYVHAQSDSFTDTAGIHFGDGRLDDFEGTVSGRVFTSYFYGQTVIRPFIQGGVDYSFAYENRIKVEGVKVSFDQSPTTLFGRAGLDFDIRNDVQGYISFRADHNDDFDTQAGEVGLTIKLN
jgi:hypothetical protein